jgi:DNA-3-methyladenine glycosylase
MRSTKLPRSFYLRPTLTVAKDLLGKYLVRKISGKTLIGKIVEVEAYLGENDPASHAYNGQTRRNEVMFRKGGHLYVYFTYGMHFCANVVTRKEGIAHAVLLRAVEPVQGIDTMKHNRNGVMEYWNTHPRQLTNGPAKFCQAFSIGRKENGTDLLGNVIFITEGEYIPRSQIIATPRIGITRAVERRWRFVVKHTTWASR